MYKVNLKIYPLWCKFELDLLNLHHKGYIMTELSRYIKEKRKEYGLTQIDLSQKSGVGLRFVREMEQGKKTLRLDKVNQVLALFGAEMLPAKKIES